MQTNQSRREFERGGLEREELQNRLDDVLEIAARQSLGNAGLCSAWINTDDLNDDNVGRDGTLLKPNDLHYSEKGYQLLAERYASKAIKILSIAEQTTKAGR